MCMSCWRREATKHDTKCKIKIHCKHPKTALSIGIPCQQNVTSFCCFHENLADISSNSVTGIFSSYVSFCSHRFLQKIDDIHCISACSFPFLSLFINLCCHQQRSVIVCNLCDCGTPIFHSKRHLWCLTQLSSLNLME